MATLARVECECLPGTVRFTTDSDLRNVSLVSSCVRGLCRMTPLDEIDSFEVELCIAEVMSNVIKHAYQGRSGLPIEVIVSLMPDHVGFEVVDVGREDHFLDRAFRFAENPLQEDALPEGGMGLAIVHQVMSEIQYQREKHENHFKMKKWFFSGWSERARESEVSI